MEHETAKELGDDIFKHELKASEKMGALFTEYEPEEAEQALIDSFIELCNKVEDPERLERVVNLMVGVSDRLGSQRGYEAAMEVAKQSEHLSVGD